MQFLGKAPNILIVDDVEIDAKLAVSQLEDSGLHFLSKRIGTTADLVSELIGFSPDVILLDPSPSGSFEVLQMLKNSGNGAPVIVRTGPSCEELALDFIREGAFDHVQKDCPELLIAAVERAVTVYQANRLKEENLSSLIDSERKFRSMVETTNEWMWEEDLAGRLLYCNPAVRAILGYSPDEIVGRFVRDLMHEDESIYGEEIYKEAIAEKRGWSKLVRRFRHRNGSTCYLESTAGPILGPGGEIAGFRGTDRDITESKRAEAQLLHDAFHDSLTGLANRTLFMEHLQLCIEKGKSRRPKKFGILYLDFDRFKVINDSLGHAEGDKLLKFIARRLEACTRPGDLVARFGGDEFVILLNDLSEPSEALLVAERIRNDLNDPFNLGQRMIFITTSIGVALSTSKPVTAEEMVRDADISMYAAKSAGGSCYQIFDEAMHAQAGRKLQMETDLRGAFDKREFCVYYQPIHRLDTSELVGFEALARWNHPVRGLVPPNEFIPIAEESDLILRLGEWTVRESCRQLREWQRLYSGAEALTVAVNLSSKEFRQPELAEHVASALRSSGLPGECLKLEITESQIMDHTDLAITIINRLRGLGVEFSLDDFGTGYSSLSYLRRLPFTYLKIDRSFVSQMCDSVENSEIVNTIIKLAQGLNMKVVAEGIETHDQLGKLVLRGCDLGQGFLFSPPMPADAARGYVREIFTGRPLGAGDPPVTQITTYRPLM